MTKKPLPTDSEKLTDIIVGGILDKKGLDIQIMDLRQLGNSVSDFFIICHGASNRQVDSISDSIQDHVHTELGEKPINVEGRAQAEWILMDFANVVVHIFQEEIRAHYALEELWADAEITAVEE